VLDLRKLCFLNIQRDHFMPVVRSFYVTSGYTSFNDLCSKYGIADVHRSVFCKHVWNVFILCISFASLLFIFSSLSLVLSTLYCMN